MSNTSANLEIVGGVVGGSAEQSVGVVSGESGLESVQKQRGSVALAQEI